MEEYKMPRYLKMILVYGFLILGNIFVYWTTSDGFRKKEWGYANMLELYITIGIALMYTIVMCNC